MRVVEAFMAFNSD